MKVLHHEDMYLEYMVVLACPQTDYQHLCDFGHLISSDLTHCVCKRKGLMSQMISNPDLLS